MKAVFSTIFRRAPKGRLSFQARAISVPFVSSHPVRLSVQVVQIPASVLGGSVAPTPCCRLMVMAPYM